MLDKGIKFLAYYLPQYHEVPENNQWWGEGFTEWTNVTKAKPFFLGHKQPVTPGELGYYNLLDIETQKAQIDLAKKYGISGFVYWHYWFGNKKQLLEQPIKNVLNDASIDFPFCFSWANESWSGIWHGAPNKILMEQEYLGDIDDIEHFNYCLNYFKDNRYIKIDNKPVFKIYKPDSHPYLKDFILLWQRLAKEAGLNGIYFIGIKPNNILNDGLDSIARYDFWFDNNKLQLKRTKSFFDKILIKIIHKLKNKYYRCDAQSYITMIRNTYNFKLKSFEFPTVLTGWDNTPRSGKKGKVLLHYNPNSFEIHLKKVCDLIKEKNEKIVFIKSWNEWAEGNHLEPEKKYGRSYLEVIKKYSNKFSH